LIISKKIREIKFACLTGDSHCDSDECPTYKWLKEDKNHERPQE